MDTQCRIPFAINMSQSNSSNNMRVPSDKAELTNLPLKLHALLEEAARLDQTFIVSWENGGTAFKVHDKKRFVDEIMPKYFSTSNYQSFQRYVTKSAIVLVRGFPRSVPTVFFNGIFRRLQKL
jgi:hypothetical protein